MKKLKITINNITYMVTVEEESENVLQAVEPQGYVNRPSSPRLSIQPLTPKPAVSNSASGTAHGILSPMAGVVMAVKVKVGDKVKKGNVVLVLEAMKMENEITAKTAGVIKEIKVKEGQTVTGGAVLMTIE